MAALVLLTHELGYAPEAGVVGKQLLERITPAEVGDRRGYLD